MLVNIQDDMMELEGLGLLGKLLVDKTTKRHILWGTDAYEERGEGYGKGREMEVSLFLYDNLGVITARADKALEQQSSRTKQHGEVFTPRWVCDRMIDALDCDFFGVETLPADAWHHIDTLFAGKKSWKKYVDNKRLEITCGEAPYLAQRYDASTGEMIPVGQRTGILDRKLHVVSFFAESEEIWIRWAMRAFEATYGYEYQGDNLLIARVNGMKTFQEHYEARWGKSPAGKVLAKLVNKLVWNFWQMDGLTLRLPYCVEDVEGETLFAYADIDIAPILAENQPDSQVYFWRSKKRVPFGQMKESDCKMKFDYIIGNPPYQDESNGDLRNYAPPIYNLFLDSAYAISDVVELIHPARFLFNAGSTPKEWNQKMLNDPHLKVLHYEPDSTKIFDNTDIKGGIAITLHNTQKDFGAIETFTAYPEINAVMKKVIHRADFKTLSEIVYSRTSYRMTGVMHADNPDAIKKLSKGHAYDMASNIFQRLPEIFFNEKPNDDNKYIQILGRENNLRVSKYIRKDYVNNPANLQSYKVYIAQANGTGAFGEALSTIIIGAPNVGATETFISIGDFKEEENARNLRKYLMTKFARALLSVLKVTQNGNKPVWRMIPMQDFTSDSDIDWSQSIHDIDQQLYKKYGLTAEEVDFIEKNVKEMK